MWRRISALLTRPDVVASELAKLDRSDPAAADLETVARTLGEIARKRTNLVAALADCDDRDSRTALTEALSRLSDHARSMEAARVELESRRSGWVAARQRIGDLQAWCQQVASKLDDLNYATRRDALMWLGVTVRVFKAGSPDRWIIDARLPLDGGLVYGTGS